MSAFYAPNCLRRLHQLHGTNGIAQPWALTTQLNYKFDDVPQTLVALGRKHVTYAAAVRLQFHGTIVDSGGTFIPRKVLTPMLISSVQLQGTEIGTPVSSSHMLGGIIDTDTYLRSANRNPVANTPGLVLAAGVSKPLNYCVDIMLGNFNQNKGHQTCPLAIFLRPGEININTPVTLAGVDASLTDTSISAMTVTAHLVLLCTTEVLIANPWQLTRHKASVGASTDSIMINSFGASSTLTGVQSKCGVGALLWAGNGLIGDAKGSGTVASITQFAADFLGLRQNNDPRALVQQLYSEVSDGKVIDTQGTLEDHSTPIYPLFDNAAAVNDIDLMTAAEFFPIIYPTRNFDASKLLEAVGNPSYDLTGIFTGPAHYTYMEGCYPYTMDMLNNLVAVIQRSHIGLEMFGTDDLVLSTKMSDSTNPMAIAVNAPEKLVYLPRIVVPRSNPAVK